MVDSYADSMPAKRAKHTLRFLERDAVIEAADYTCAYCGRRHVGFNDNRDQVDPDGKTWNLDHVMPVSRGGSWGAENNALSCARCNGLKGKRLLSELPEHLLQMRATIDAMLANQDQWPEGA